MSRGAVSLPLTYVYAVLIGIVVFIVATRVVGVQGEQANAQLEQEILDYFDATIDALGSDPYVIQNISIERLMLRLDWTDGGRIRVGSRDERLRTPTFSERELESDVVAWAYPYRIETTSVPLLFLSDGRITYQVNGSDRQALLEDAPTRRDRYGLVLVGSTIPSTGQTTKDLCIGDASHGSWAGCELRFVSEQMPYGYLSWPGGHWYPVYSRGALFAALFAADERSWNSTMPEIYARDEITRAVLLERAEMLEDDVAASSPCTGLYTTAMSELGTIESSISHTPVNEPDISSLDLTVFEHISDSIEALHDADLVLFRNGCPEVAG